MTPVKVRWIKTRPLRTHLPYRITICLFSSFILLIVAYRAFAHTRSQSFSSWYMHGEQVWMSFSVQTLEATRLGLLEQETRDLTQVLVRHLASNISVHTEQELCRPVANPQARAAREGYLRVEWRFVCSTDDAMTIVNNAFFAVAPSHVHYARIRGNTRGAVEILFTNTERRHRLVVDKPGTADSRGASLVAYLRLGVEHILAGVDHLAFLLALLLLCRRVREVAYLVTGFTLGHSLTLSLAALGVVRPNVSVIEALIGFTIALVAVENIGVTTRANEKLAWVMSGALLLFAALQNLFHLGVPMVTLLGLALFTGCYLLLVDTPERARRWRPTLTVLFGLIHGFGFASVLLEIGLPTDRLLAALLGFNIGVECGQLGVVAVLWLIGSQVARRFPSTHHRFILDATSVALCALGLFWFVERALSV